MSREKNSSSLQLLAQSIIDDNLVTLLGSINQLYVRKIIGEFNVGNSIAYEQSFC